MTLAMRNSLGAGTYTNIAPVIDPDVAIDSLVPACANVASALGSYIQIVKDILAFGTGYVDATPQNLNSEGNWTSLRVYTNYNIIEDPLLPDSECADVISSVDSLFANVTDILNEESVSSLFLITLTEKPKSSNSIGKMAQKLTLRKMRTSSSLSMPYYSNPSITQLTQVAMHIILTEL